ncbi:hypothetical protein PCANC_21263 [Puccinia coronata f. sp. avenae]|uniref:Polynucleotide 5'-hydroxyl-kinase GRC3 n=1 Tax=Puccinia coronata f. sp. avenae TaxID=200324 RepID=A0A2N5S8J1_9BASI|nr:hypothetical protein PCANC_21263 [Puccinia coronata f. sp. avenae]PLW33728.1 hypothetical protein PCASD_12497 [Puccinia coronata f. sp. avenae]
MSISAIAARKEQQKITAEEKEEQKQEEEKQEQQEQQQQNRKKTERYYYRNSTNQQEQRITSTPKQKNQHTRSTGFIDPDTISNWNPIQEGEQKNYYSQHTSCVIGLRDHQNLIPHGTLQLTVLHGTIQLMGAEITTVGPSSQVQHLFAPPSHPLPIISAKSTTPETTSQQQQQQQRQQQQQQQQQALPLDPNKFHAIIQLQDLHCGIQDVDLLWASSGNKRPIWSSHQHSIHGQTWSIVLSLTPDLARLRLPASWSSSLSELKPNDQRADERSDIYLIEGPKGAGKSTFATLLVNSLLNQFQQVALLDLDPGQPLLTPPTLLSLHVLSSPILGPSFCQLVSPHQPSSHSIYIGHTTPKDCPTRYTEAGLELFNLYTTLQSDLTATCQSSSHHKRRRRGRNTPQIPAQEREHSRRTDQIPLVINTMGWTRGLGQDLLNHLFQSIQPTHIFSFSDRPLLSDIESSTTLEPIGPTPLSLRITPIDCRVLSILSYLHSNPSPSPHFVFISQWDFQYPLWARRPFELRPDRVELPDHPDFNLDHLGHVLNGSLIGFVHRSQGWWIGFGLVRAIDPARNTLHLLTPAYPTSEHNPAHYQLVKYSEPELPLVICLLSDPGPVPYIEKDALNTTSSTVGAEKKRIRRNVQRRSQISR